MSEPSPSEPSRSGWLRSFREEIADFRKAVRETPEPELSWDVLGLRSLLGRVLKRLLSEHIEPWKMGVAMAVGVLIGSSPLYGFHILLCLVAAMGLRLNKLVVWMGSNVSIPFLAPFFAFLSIQCGHLMRNGELAPIKIETLRSEGALGLFGYWLLGFPIVGTIAGAVLGLLTVWLARRHQERRNRNFPA